MKKILLTLAIAITCYCSYAQYLPLTAGSGNPLTGDLHIDGTNGGALIFSYGGVSNNKVLLGSTYSIFGAGSKDDFATYIRNSNSYSIWTNNLQRFTVDGNGNIGIGTSSPGRNLDVVEIGGSALSGTGFSVSGVYQNHTTYRGIELGYDASGQIGIIAGASGGAPSNLAFWTYNGSGSWLERMRINSSGNVAIGTTDPKGYKLAVAGDAVAESMTVDLQANWPDYVFKKDYSLTPLSEVKTYIDKNQHLPEVPTSEQVAKGGINLGEMNALLMKKVEELTLYLIEKDKQDIEKDARLQSQQQQIDELKQQIKIIIANQQHKNTKAQ